MSKWNNKCLCIVLYCVLYCIVLFAVSNELYYGVVNSNSYIIVIVIIYEVEVLEHINSTCY